MFFIANGPWTNWEHSINDPKNGDIITWATKKNDGGFYSKLKLGDTVFMANQPSPDNGPYSRKVVFGFGNVMKIYHETKPYWPIGSGWVNRLDIKPTFVAKTDENAFKWNNRLAPYGLRTISNSNPVLKKIK